MKGQTHKLVLFDIDGTLIRSLRPVDALQRFRYSIQEVFGKDIGEITKNYWKEHGYNGMSDRSILWDMIKDMGITKDQFIDNLGGISDKFTQYLDMISPDGPVYTSIPEAKKLVDLVIEAEHLSQGILTGNLGKAATWKLHAAGYPDFAFGVFGHEADYRADLAKLIIPKAEKHFGQTFAPKDIIIIGDTINDIICARAIGASVVIVATGWDVSIDDLKKAQPDLFIDSLLDERVLHLLGLKKGI